MRHGGMGVAGAGAAVAACLALAGCATLSEGECLGGQWSAIGFEDGEAGQPPERVGSHAEACSRYGIAPDYAAWNQGYANGLVLYCTRGGGFRSGVQGATYHGVCTGEAEYVFLEAFRDGRLVYDVRHALSDARGDYSRVLSEIDDAREDRDWVRDQARSPEITDEQRDAYLDQAEELSEKIGRLERELYDIEHSIREIEDDERDISARMRFVYPEWDGY